MALLTWGAAAFAQEDGTDDSASTGGDSLELTIMLLPANATTPDAVTRVIELPARAAAQAAENAAGGLETANSARENRGGGNDTAEQAREGGSEFGQAMRELAQENRENAVRGGPPDDAGRPENPGPPVNPGPPGNPGPPQN